MWMRLVSNKRDPCLHECWKRISDRYAKEDQIQFLKCLKEEGCTVYWSNLYQRLILRSRPGENETSSKRFMVEAAEILGIKSREDWIELKTKYSL